MSARMAWAVRMSRDGSAALVGRARRTLRLGAAVGLVVGASGCYNAGNNLMAQSAQKSFNEAAIGGSLDEERKLSKTMLDEEVTAIRKEVTAMRDKALAIILDGTWDTFEKENTFNTQRLTGSNGGFYAAYAQMDVAAKNLSDADKTYRTLKAAIERRGAPDLSCPADGPDPAFPEKLDASLQSLQASVLQYRDACMLYRKQYAALPGSLKGKPKDPSETGSIGAVRNDLADAEGQIETWKNESKQAKKDFEEAQAAYKKAQGPTADVQTLEAVQKALKTAKDKLDANPIAAAQVATERLTVVTDSIERILGGKPADDSALELVLSAAIRLERIEADQKLPLLLLESERLQSLKTSAALKLEHATARRALLQARHDALVDQLRDLTEARRAYNRTKELAAKPPISPPAAPPAAAAGGSGKAQPDKGKKNEPVTPPPPPPPAGCTEGGMRVAESFDRAEGECREQIVEALLHYANSWTLGELRAQVALRLFTGDLHAEAVDLSAAAMQAWENVLAVPIEQIVKRHVSGLKPEEVAQIMQLIVQGAGFTALTATTGMRP